MKILTTNDLSRSDALRWRGLYEQVCKYTECNQYCVEFIRSPRKRFPDRNLFELTAMKHPLFLHFKLSLIVNGKFVLLTKNKCILM